MTDARKRLEQMPIAGNAYDDAPIFTEAHKILTDPEAPFQDKIAALCKIDATMGEQGEYDQEAIDHYLAQTAQPRQPHEELEAVILSTIEETFAHGKFDLDCGNLHSAANGEGGFDVWIEADPEQDDCTVFATITIKSYKGG